MLVHHDPATMKSVGKQIYLTIILCVMFLLPGYRLQAQEVFQTDGRECEVNRLYLNDLARRVMETKERLFVIARLGTGENNRYLNYRRLYNVREYFNLNFGKQLPEENLLLAESKTIKGSGRVEFYLGSKLVMQVSFKRRSDFCVDCCEGFENIYYGWGKKDRKKNKF